MTNNGLLDASWGVSETKSDASCVRSSASTGECDGCYSLRMFVEDKGIQHSLCLASFLAVTSEFGSLNNQAELQECLNTLSRRLDVEQFTVEEIDELWCGSVNFYSFLALSRDLFHSLHMALING